MDLGRAIDKFAHNTIEKWDFGTSTWVDTGITGGLQVYDRFISERTFGQTKRILTTPWEEALPLDRDVEEIFRIGSGSMSTQFCIEGLNEDVYCDTKYSNVYMVHDLPYSAVIGTYEGTTRASGIGRDDVWTPVRTTWADYNRYSSANSKEFSTVDYSIVNLFFPRGTPITVDSFVRMDGLEFDINEIATSIHIIHCRALQVGVEAPQ